ncbi:MAG: hypothetical protein D4R65_04370, partial [Verrucomicrobiaceae bacterium]
TGDQITPALRRRPHSPAYATLRQANGGDLCLSRFDRALSKFDRAATKDYSGGAAMDTGGGRTFPA